MTLYKCRRHPTPTKEMLEPLLRTAAAVGLDLDISSSKGLADSLDRAVVRILLIDSYILLRVCLARLHCIVASLGTFEKAAF